MLGSKRDLIISQLREYVKNRADQIAALYIFGSFARNEPVINDIDLLLLPAREARKEEVYLRVSLDLEKLLQKFKVDIVLFDTNEVDPLLLHKALSEGIPIVNDRDYLGDKIEALSAVLLGTEYLRKERHRYLMEFLSA